MRRRRQYHIIVYGMAEKDHVASFIDEGFSEAEVSKEFLDQVINSGIQPRVEGFKIHRVSLSNRDDRVAYVVEIPQATVRGPHQTRDGRYYKRSNFTSVIMEDYEIRDVLRRARSPQLEARWHLPNPHVTSELNDSADAKELRSSPLELELIITNHSPQALTTLLVGSTLIPS